MCFFYIKTYIYYTIMMMLRRQTLKVSLVLPHPSFNNVTFDSDIACKKRHFGTKGHWGLLQCYHISASTMSPLTTTQHVRKVTLGPSYMCAYCSVTTVDNIQASTMPPLTTTQHVRKDSLGPRDICIQYYHIPASTMSPLTTTQHVRKGTLGPRDICFQYYHIHASTMSPLTATHVRKVPLGPRDILCKGIFFACTLQ